MVLTCMSDSRAAGGVCSSARVDEAFVLPDGSQHSAGELTVCVSQNLTPVASLHRTFVDGMPIGACLARGHAATILQPGNHGSTFGGNLLACAAAHAVLDTLDADNLIERAQHLGSMIVSGLTKALAGNNSVVDIRGKGLMIAVELSSPCTELVTAAISAGLLLNVTRDNVVRLLPPLTLSDAEAEALIRIVAQVINDG